MATRSRPGTARIGPWLYEAIRRLSLKCEAVIVSVHAGSEMSLWPAPSIQELYRSLIQAGATVVHGHHSHVPQGVEEYAEGLIVYGAGNFLVDPAHWQTHANTLWSLGVEVDLAATPLKHRLLTFEIRTRADGSLLTEPSTDDEFAQHQPYLKAAQEPLSDPDLLESLWHKTSLHNFETFYGGCLGLASGDIEYLTARQRWRFCPVGGGASC